MNNKLLSFGTTNFKAIKNLRIEIAPITLLVGPNSSGKSSIIKALLLIKENINKENAIESDIENLDLQLKDLNLGGFDKVLNNKSTEEKFTFGIRYESEYLGETILELTYKKENNNSAKLDLFLIGTINDVIFAYDKTVENNYEYWKIGFIINLWQEIFQKLLEKGNDYLKAEALYNELYKLREKFGKNCLKKLTGRFKSDYEYFISKGINPIEPGFLEKSSDDPLIFSPPDFYGQLWYIDNNKRIIPNENILNLAKHSDKIGCMVSYPLYDRPEFAECFDEENNIRISPSIKNEIKKDDFNFDVYLDLLKIFNNLNLTTKADVIEYCKRYDKYAIKMVAENPINNQLRFGSFRMDKNKLDPETLKFEHFSKKNFNEMIRWLSNLHSKVVDVKLGNELDLANYIYFDNDINNYENNILTLGKTPNKSWDKFQKSVNLMLDIINDIISNSLDTLKSLNEVKYIRSERGNFKRLILKSDESIFNRLLLEYIQLNVPEDKKKAVLQQWFKTFEIADDFEIEEDEEGLGYRFYLIINEKRIHINDIGYGLNKLIPLVFQLFLADDNSLIIIEEPESNLHPKYQSFLADIIVRAAMHNKPKFIIETHSEYFIRKLQFLIASKKYDFSSDDAVIYDFKNPKNLKENEKQTKKITFREDGSLSENLSSGFMDEALNWKNELIRIKNQNQN